MLNPAWTIIPPVRALRTNRIYMCPTRTIPVTPVQPHVERKAWRRTLIVSQLRNAPQPVQEPPPKSIRGGSSVPPS